MLVNFLLNDEINIAMPETKYEIEIAPHETVENLKVLLTIKYPEINIEQVNFYLNEKELKNNYTIKTLELQDASIILIKRKVNICCCNLI